MLKRTVPQILFHLLHQIQIRIISRLTRLPSLYACLPVSPFLVEVVVVPYTACLPLRLCLDPAQSFVPLPVIVYLLQFQ